MTSYVVLMDGDTEIDRVGVGVGAWELNSDAFLRVISKMISRGELKDDPEFGVASEFFKYVDAPVGTLPFEDLRGRPTWVQLLTQYSDLICEKMGDDDRSTTYRTHIIPKLIDFLKTDYDIDWEY